MRLGQVAFVTKQLAKQPLGELGQRLDIGMVQRASSSSRQFTAVVDDQMQFEAELQPIEPRPRVANLQRPCADECDDCRTAMKVEVNEADASTASEQAEQVGAQPRENPRHELDEACVTDQGRKLTMQIHLDVLRVVRLKCPVLALVEVDQDRHDFAVAQLPFSFSMCCAVAEAFGDGFEFALLAEIIDMAEQFQ